MGKGQGRKEAAVDRLMSCFLCFVFLEYIGLAFDVCSADTCWLPRVAVIGPCGRCIIEIYRHSAY